MTKTSSWTDALANAKNIIIVGIKAMETSSFARYATVIVQKDEITSSSSFHLGTGGYYSASDNWNIQATCTSSSCTVNYAKNGALITNLTLTYYYD